MTNNKHETLYTVHGTQDKQQQTWIHETWMHTSLVHDKSTDYLQVDMDAYDPCATIYERTWEIYVFWDTWMEGDTQ